MKPSRKGIFSLYTRYSAPVRKVHWSSHSNTLGMEPAFPSRSTVCVLMRSFCELKPHSKSVIRANGAQSKRMPPLIRAGSVSSVSALA